MASLQGSPRGYDFEFIPALPDELHCSICYLVFKDSVQTICGHRFCQDCLAEFHRRFRKVCPLDNIEVAVGDIFPDNATRRKILSSPVACPNDGCDWIQELSKVDNHKKECPFEKVACSHPDCKELVIRSNLFEHEVFTCLWRNYQCFHCKDCFSFDNKEVHEETCRKFPIKCSNGCTDDTMPREKLQAHLDNICPLALVDCLYKHIGCPVKVKRKELDQHIRNSSQYHLNVACEKISELAEKVEEQEKTIQDIKNIKEVLKAVKSCQSPKHFVWKIQQFQQMLQDAKAGRKLCFCSDSFYTGPQGYHLQILLYPDGHSDATRNNISVLAWILKGEYDAILPWPFRKEITFTLFDQQENEVDRKNVKLSMTFPPDNKFIKRPTDKNVAYGFGNFVSQEELKSRRYVVDDALFLRVDISELQYS